MPVTAHEVRTCRGGRQLVSPRGGEPELDHGAYLSRRDDLRARRIYADAWKGLRLLALPP